MGKYITENQRYIIETMLKDKKTVKEISERLGKHISTIYNEIKRGTITLLNSDLTTRDEYCADVAQRIFKERQLNKGRSLKLSSEDDISLFLEDKIINEHYSPYAAIQAAFRSGRFDVSICKATLYSYIDKGFFKNLSNKHLYSKKIKKKKETSAKRPSFHNLKGKSIEERPCSVSDREELGHWEMDTVYSGKNKGKSCLLVLTERASRMEKILKMADRTLQSTIKALNKLERKLGAKKFRETFKTITCDNGVEFSDVDKIQGSCINKTINRTELFFCHPYSSWERGSNENANKLIRHWIPKGDDIGKYSDYQIQEIEDWINHYPRELFQGQSSFQILQSLIQSA